MSTSITHPAFGRKQRAYIVGSFIFFCAVLFGACDSGNGILVHDLRCEHISNPLGIDTETPRFSWKLTDAKHIRGQRQTAYRILVATTRDKLNAGKADVWDSDTVPSDHSHLVPYGGEKLRSGGDYYWKVMAFDINGNASRWSKPARFSIGLLNRAEWHGKWIKHPTATPEKHIWFRKRLTLDSDAASSFIYIASLGYHELYVNGRKADRRVLAPAVSRLDKRALYVTYDIAPLLRKGTNVIALWYAAGWSRYSSFAPTTNQALLVQLLGTTTNGTFFSLHSDDEWKCAESYSRNSGGFRFMDMGGEETDGRRYNKTWNTVPFDDSKWANAAVTAPVKTQTEVILSAQMTDPSYIIETIPAREIIDTIPGVLRVDMGKSFTGFLQVGFNGLNAGDTVVIKISNRRDIHPGFEGENIGNNAINEFNQTQYYIARGEDGEQFRNRFNYFGGRYIHFIGLRQTPTLADITGFAVSSAAERTGHFWCSDTLLNRIYELDRRTYEMCHTEGVTVDCSNRERLGYGPEGAYQTTWGLGLPCFASAAHYIKNVRDWSDVQREDGSINYVAPQTPRMWGCALNGAANMNIALEHYLAHGDKKILEESFDTGKRWIEFLNRYVIDGMLTPYAEGGEFLGDWLMPGPIQEFGGSPQALFFNNCVYVMTLDFYIRIAEILGKDSETAPYREMLQTARRQIHRTYFNPDLNSYLNGDQVRTSFALFAGIVPDSLREAALQHLQRDMTGEHPYFNIGSFARYPYFKTLFADRRFDEIISNILSKTTYPGYGYFVARGETALPETWEIEHRSSALMHTGYTGISAWFIKRLAGIEPDAAAPGYKTFTLRPTVVKNLSCAKAELESPYGTIKSGWQKDSDRVIYNICVPVNSTADIYLPAEAQRITENGQSLAASPGIEVIGENDGYLHLRAASGEYQFEVINNN